MPADRTSTPSISAEITAPLEAVDPIQHDHRIVRIPSKAKYHRGVDQVRRRQDMRVTELQIDRRDAGLGYRGAGKLPAIGVDDEQLPRQRVGVVDRQPD